MERESSEIPEGTTSSSSPLPPNKLQNLSDQQDNPKYSIPLPILAGNAKIHLNLIIQDVKVELVESLKARIDAEIANGNETVETRNELETKSNPDPTWKRFIGILFALFSSLTLELALLLVKLLPAYHPYTVTLWRFQGVLLPSLLIVFYYRVAKKERVFKTIFPFTKTSLRTLLFLILRCATGASGLILLYYSIQFINVADSSVIASTTPVFVSLAAAILLDEKSGFIPVLCGIVTLVGVGIIARPPMLTGAVGFDRETLIGTALALGCMICSGFAFLLLRHLRQTHFAVMTLAYGLWGSIQSLAMSATINNFQLPENNHDLILALAQALLTFLGQLFMTLAFKYEKAGMVSLVRTCDIVFAYIWQYIILGVAPDIYSGIGGVIIIGGVVVAALRKFLEELPDDNKVKKRMRLLLM